MGWYVVESYDYEVLHGGRESQGVVGEHRGSEKIYLHALELSQADITQLGPREDEHGNRQHDRLALPRNEEWWIAVDGEVHWPKCFRPPIRSYCSDLGSRPKPVALPSADLERLRKVGVKGLPATD
jgi:hypothetical protein